MSRPTTRRGLSGLALALALALAPAGAAFAQGGKGGGGGGGTTTTSTGVIKGSYGSAVPCDGGSVLSVTVGKSSNKGVETVLLMSGTTAGWWMFELREDTTGKLWQGHGTTMTELGTSVARLTTATGASLPKGTWNVTYDAVRHDGGFDGPALETCQAHLTIVVA